MSQLFSVFHSFNQTSGIASRVASVNELGSSRIPEACTPIGAIDVSKPERRVDDATFDCSQLEIGQ